MELIKYLFQLFVESVFYIINFVLCWGMNIENNDITPVISTYFKSSDVKHE
jgi:hypothetical protein